MNYPTNPAIEAVLRQIRSINLVPVRSVQSWFPTEEDEITFRVTTADREIFYISFPANAQSESETQP